LGITLAADNFKTQIVWLILNSKTEDALELLAKNYKVDVPDLEIGLPKGHKTKALGCYTAKTKTIYLLSSDYLNNPFVVIHEFYHHLRSKGVDCMHKGTERGADKFALEFISEYQLAAKKSLESQ
jgi:hypothetical protein